MRTSRMETRKQFRLCENLAVEAEWCEVLATNRVNERIGGWVNEVADFGVGGESQGRICVGG